MRLQLIGVFAVLVTSTVRADVTSETAARVDVYSDEWVTVISPSWLGSVKPTEALTIEARYAVDVLSGATQVMVADAITSATSFAEERHQGGAAVTAQLAPQWTFGGSFNASVEPDFSTYSAGINGSVELFERAATLSLGYDVRFDEAGLATDATFGEQTTGHSLNLAWRHVLTRQTLLTVLLTGNLVSCGDLIGCHSSPYRYVPMLRSATDDTMQVALRERHPELLVQGAAAIRASQYLGEGFGLHGGYRFFRDNWAITGHTADLSLAKSLFAERLVLHLDGRFTHQSAASFYQGRYTVGDGAAMPAYRTADREMAGLIHGLVGGRIDWSVSNLGPLSSLRVSARVARLWYRYPDFDALPERNAWLIGGGLGAKF